MYSQIFWTTTIQGHKFFWTQTFFESTIFLARKFLGFKIFVPKVYTQQIFTGPIFFIQNFFINIFDQIWTQIYFWPKIFLNQPVFRTKKKYFVLKFSGPNFLPKNFFILNIILAHILLWIFLWPHFVLGPKICWTFDIKFQSTNHNALEDAFWLWPWPNLSIHFFKTHTFLIRQIYLSIIQQVVLWWRNISQIRNIAQLLSCMKQLAGSTRRRDLCKKKYSLWTLCLFVDMAKIYIFVSLSRLFAYLRPTWNLTWLEFLQVFACNLATKWYDYVPVDHPSPAQWVDQIC